MKAFWDNGAFVHVHVHGAQAYQELVEAFGPADRLEFATAVCPCCGDLLYGNDGRVLKWTHHKCPHCTAHFRYHAESDTTVVLVKGYFDMEGRYCG